jgi:hypothetical protein
VGLLGVGVWVGSYTLLGPERTPVGWLVVSWSGGVCLWSAPGLGCLTRPFPGVHVCACVCMCVHVCVVGGGCGGGVGGLGCGCVLSVA